MRNSLENPDVITQSAISAREQLGMAVADKIRQMSTAKDLKKVAGEVLPHFEKFLESPEEKRLRRIRSGVVTAAIGLGASIVVFIMAMDKVDLIPFITPALVTFLVGIGVIINGLLFTLPKKQLPGDVYDALSQKVLDSRPNLTNELAPAPVPKLQAPSITEHTTHHLKS